MIADVVLPVALAVVMASLGLSLTLDDFRRIVRFPKGVSIGIVNLLAISPLLAFAVAEVYSLAPELAEGLVLLGASPGGTTANMLTHLARGDTALSVTMTALSSIAAVITVPLFLELAIEHFGAVGFDGDPSMGGIVARVFLITTVPLALGMYLRSRWPQRAQELEGRARRVALIVFVLVVIGAVVSEWDTLSGSFTEVALAALTLNVVAMTISFTIAKLSRLDDRQATAIAMELGIHNSTLTIAVATSVDTSLAIPAAVYSAFMFLTAGLSARTMYRRNGVGASTAAG